MAMVLAIVLAACTGADDSASSATASPATEDPASDDEPEIVGKVLEIVRIEGRVAGDDALAGTGIPRGAELATDGTGIIRFAFDAVRTTCVLYGASAVLVIGNAQRLLRHLSGEATCEVDGSPQAIRLDVNGRTVVVQRGTVRVAVTETGGGMQVLEGRAELDREERPPQGDPQPGGEDPGDEGLPNVILGPGDQTGWDSSGILDSAVTFGALDPTERAATSELTGGTLPTGDATPGSAATSAAPADGDEPTADADVDDPPDGAGGRTDDTGGGTDADTNDTGGGTDDAGGTDADTDDAAGDTDAGDGGDGADAEPPVDTGE